MNVFSFHNWTTSLKNLRILSSFFYYYLLHKKVQFKGNWSPTKLFAQFDLTNNISSINKLCFFFNYLVFNVTGSIFRRQRARYNRDAAVRARQLRGGVLWWAGGRPGGTRARVHVRTGPWRRLLHVLLQAAGSTVLVSLHLCIMKSLIAEI